MTRMFSFVGILKEFSLESKDLKIKIKTKFLEQFIQREVTLSFGKEGALTIFELVNSSYLVLLLALFL